MTKETTISTKLRFIFVFWFFNSMHLENVSTVRGSGWVADPNAKLRLIMNMIATHPLPRTVLTVSSAILTFEAKPRSGHHRYRGFLLRRSNMFIAPDS